MKRSSIIFSVILILLPIINAHSIPWPVDSQNLAHALEKTYGDWNSQPVDSLLCLGFHGGIDICADSGDCVFAVINGVISARRRGTGSDSGFINIAIDTSNTELAWHYGHILLYDTLCNENDPVSIGDTLGYVAAFYYGPTYQRDHLHFQLSHNDWTKVTAYCNPLDELTPAPLQTPGIRPRANPPEHHNWCIYYVSDGDDDTTNFYETTYLRDSIDILLRAYTSVEDTITNGVYSVDYCVEPIGIGDSIPIRTVFEMRDTINIIDSTKYYLIYAEGVSAHFNNWYVITNCGDSLPSDSSGLYNIQENCWWTSSNITGTANADSIEDAKFPDGFYITTIKVWSHSNDSAIALDTILVDNFNPKIKETRPTNWFAFVPDHEKRIWCFFSEAMDTTTLTSSNIEIKSLKDDSVYTITNLIYDDDSCKLTLEVDNFRLGDSVEVRLLEGITDLAGKSIDTTGAEQNVAFSWNFVVGIIQLTDNNVNDVQPDVYHDNIVWTQTSSADSFTMGEIVLYDFYNKTLDTISSGGGIHNSPCIFDNKIAWFGYEWGDYNPVYYYNGTSSTQIAPDDKGRYSLEISEGGVAWRAYKGSLTEYDTIWIECYDLNAMHVDTLDQFREWYGREFGAVDIDGNEVVWDHCHSDLTHFDVYYYDSIVQNFSNDPDSNDRVPSISEGQITWTKEWGTSDISYVWFYDGTTKRKIEYSDPPAHTPQVHNGSIVWMDNPVADTFRLIFFDGRDTLELNRRKEGIWNLPYPYYCIHNKQVGFLRLSYDTYPYLREYYNASFFDGNSVLHLTVDTLASGHVNRIEVHDGFVVFDAWDGNDYEIYLYIGDTLYTPPVIAQNLRHEIQEVDASAKPTKQKEKTARIAQNLQYEDQELDVPPIPTKKKAQPARADSVHIKLTWDLNSEPDLAGYNIYRSAYAYNYGTSPYSTVEEPGTTFTDTLPLDGENYYVVTAFDNLNNESGFSNQTLADLTPDTIPPPPPESLVAVCDSPYHEVSLTWHLVSEPEVSYRVYRADSSGGYTTPLATVSDTPFVDTTVVQDYTYYYVVTAVDSLSNESGYSNEDTILIPDITPPSPPTNFAAVFDSINKDVDLSWNAPSDPDLDWYLIYRADTSGGYTTPLDSVEASTTTFVDTTILSDTTYYYVVTAVDTNDNESAYSNEDTVIVPDIIAPSPPTNMVAAYDPTSQIVTLNWSAPSAPDLALYCVYRSEVSGSYATPLDTIYRPNTTFKDSTMSLGNTYYYVVTAVDSTNNESSYSNEDTVTIPIRFMSSSPLATAFNNGFRMVRHPVSDDLFLSYALSDTSSLCTSTPDDGSTWSRSAFVGPGCFPSLALDSDNNLHCIFRGIIDMDYLGQPSTNISSLDDQITALSRPPRSYMPNYRTTYYTIGYGDYTNSIWQNTYLYSTQDSILSVSFAIDPCDTGWVVFNTYNQLGQNSLKIGKFYTPDPPDELEDVTTLDSWTGYGRSALLVRESDTTLWIVYDADTAAICKWRTSGGTWNTLVIDVDGLYPCLSLSSTGNLIHIVWELNSTENQKERIILWTYTNGYLFLSPVQLAELNSENSYPFINKGSVVTWCDEEGIGPNKRYEVFSRQRDEYGIWSTAENISQSSIDSKYPQVNLHQSGSETYVRYIWTEGEQTPYEMKTLQTASDPVPLYAFNLGEEQPCVFSKRRGGRAQWGDGYAECADYDSDFLHYTIPGLDPTRLYRLKLVFYQDESDDVWQQAVEIDDYKIKDITLDNDEIHTEDIIVPAVCYQDKSIDLKIRRLAGPKAVLSTMSVWEYDDGHALRRTSRSNVQDNATVSLDRVCFDRITPNPTRQNPIIKFSAPNECKVVVTLFDVTGRLIDLVFDGDVTGSHEIPIRSENLSAGIYFVRIETGDEIFTDKVILLR